MSTTTYTAKWDLESQDHDCEPLYLEIYEGERKLFVLCSCECNDFDPTPNPAALDSEGVTPELITTAEVLFAGRPDWSDFTFEH